MLVYRLIAWIALGSTAYTLCKLDWELGLLGIALLVAPTVVWHGTMRGRGAVVLWSTRALRARVACDALLGTLFFVLGPAGIGSGLLIGVLFPLLLMVVLTLGAFRFAFSFREIEALRLENQDVYLDGMGKKPERVLYLGRSGADIVVVTDAGRQLYAPGWWQARHLDSLVARFNPAPLQGETA